jgi:hypothetical protein
MLLHLLVYVLTAALLSFWLLTLFREVEFHDVFLSRCMVFVRACEGKIDGTIAWGQAAEIWAEGTMLAERPSTSRLRLLNFTSNHAPHEKLGLVLPDLNAYAIPRFQLPIKLRRVVIPVWIFLAPLLFLSLIILVQSINRWRKGGCYFCGYDLKGNVSGRCPECGKAVAYGVRRLLQPLVLIRDYFHISRRKWLSRIAITAAFVIVLNFGWNFLINDNCYAWTCSHCGLRIEVLTSSNMKRVLNGHSLMRKRHDHTWELDRPWEQPWMFWSWAGRCFNDSPSIEMILQSDPSEFGLGMGGQVAAQFDASSFGEIMRKTYPMFEFRKTTFKR